MDTQGSQILGRINANGQVWLINPNGVLFGKDAQINVGGLVASTLEPDNASIGSARSNFSGSSTAGVVNFGQINTAQGGYVALLGHSVSNSGQVSAPGGTVALGAGSAVSLNFAGSKLLGLQVTSNQVNALAENGGLIQADGGQVLLSAGARDSLLASVVNNTGVIQARTVQEQEGKIVLLAGMEAGTTNVGGTLDASAPSGGNGGFIETSAYTVKVSDSASITTASAHGKQGQWLIDPFDFYIASSGGNITGAALGNALNSNDVTIQTVAAANPTITGATAGGSYTSGLGDIVVNDSVSWNANYTLTLNAHNSIYINSAITASGASGKLALQYSQGTSTGSYSLKAPVSLQAAVATSTSGNFSTKLAGAATTYYTVITSLGSAGDQGVAGATNSLQGLAYSTRLSGSYVLGADIAASGTSTWNSNSGFSPIGDAAGYFTGTFDGLGHTITGLTISRSATDYVGLFGLVSSAASILNTGLVGGSVTGSSYVGNLAGAVSVGATVSGSYATGSVSGTTNYAGGLVGVLSLGTISNSYATGAVSGAARQMGGLVGSFSEGTIISSYATGAVNGASIAGGLVGNQSAAGTISASYATGAVSGGAYGGGLVGYSTGTISSSYATGTATGVNLAGGLVAYQVQGSIASSYATGAVSASGSASTGWAGGLVASNGGTITNSYATGAVSAALHAGGLVGVSNSTVSSSYATGTVRSTSTAGFVGGLIGASNQLSVVTNSYATGAVTGAYWVGGLMGYNTGILSGSYASGAVTGSTGAVRVGGLVGSMQLGGTVSDSYATGAVSGGTYRGGLVGMVNTTTRYSISNTYATGVVSSSGATNYGGLIGSVASGSVGSVSNSFWNSDNTSSAGFGSAGTGLSSTAMKTASNFSTWSISSSGGSSSTWRIYAGSTAPLLRSFLTALATDTLTTYTGAVQFGTGYGLSNVFGTVASGTNAGTYTGGTLYSNQQGYDLTGTGKLTIAKASLTITGNSASSTYTGVAQTLTGYTASGLLGSDTASSLSGVSASVSGTNAGSYTNSVTASTQTNYAVTTANGTLTINKKALTVSGTSASSKTYDGNTLAAISVGTLSGFVNSETVSATASGTFDSQNAGSRTATASYTLVNGSGLAANYSLADTTGHSATINKKALTVSGTTASGKTYDGNTSAAITVGTLSGLVNSETLGATASGTFDSQNAGSRTATASYTLVNGTNGGLASNYSLADTTGHSATINKKALTVSGTSAAGKTYDGNTLAAISVGTLSGLLNSETLSATASGTFDSQNAGSRTATASYTLVNGTGLASNYSLADTTGHSATINKKALTYTAEAASFRTGTPLAGLTGKLSGFVNQETQSTATTGMLAWVTPATSASGAGSYAINGSGLLANNYSFSQAEGNAAALTMTQATSIVPVVSTAAPVIDTSLTKTPELVPAGEQVRALNNASSSPPTGSGAEQALGSRGVSNVIQPLGESRRLYVRGDGINLPNGYYQAPTTNLE